MRYTLHSIPRVPLDEFAASNSLKLVVSERDLPLGTPTHYSAEFCGCKTPALCGEGPTPEDAVYDYINKISGETLIVYRNGVESSIAVPRIRMTLLHPEPDSPSPAPAPSPGQ